MPSFEHIENCLRLLDAFLLGQWVASGADVVGEATDGDEGEENLRWSKHLDANREDGFAHELVALCVIAELMAQDKDQDDDRLQAIGTLTPLPIQQN